MNPHRNGQAAGQGNAFLVAPFALIFLTFSLPAQADVPRVVASIKAVHSLVAAVMAGVGEPGLLVGGSGSPHTYVLRPSESRALSRTDLVFWIGPEFEGFLVKPLSDLAPDAVSFPLMHQPGVTVLPGRRGGLWPAAETGEQPQTGAYDTDGHIWLDPLNVIEMVRAIAARLQQGDKANAARYKANADKLIADLEKLNQRLDSQLSSYRDIPFIVFHDAFQYFEKRYGLKAVGFVVVTPEQLTSTQRISDVSEKIQETNPVCIFTEPLFDPRLVRTLMEGTDMRLGSLDPEGVTLLAGPGFYFTLMNRLADSLAECLSGVSENGR